MDLEHTYLVDLCKFLMHRKPEGSIYLNFKNTTNFI